MLNSELHLPRLNPSHKEQVTKGSVVLLFIRNCIKHALLPDPTFNILDSLWYEVHMLSECAEQLRTIENKTVLSGHSVHVRLL